MFLKITNLNRIKTLPNLVIVVLLTATILSCSKDDEERPPVIADEISQNIKELIYFKGDEKAQTVMIIVPGGPSTKFATDIVDDFAPALSPKGILTVTVQQAQTLNPNILTGKEITLDQAVSYNTETIETLYEVVRYFKDEGRTVYITGLSYGAFVTQELIATKGMATADKYLIMLGRLDINDVFWQGLAEGRPAEFQNGITPIIGPEPFDNVFNRNEARLFAGLVMNRYTQDFNPIEDLSNITYIYGATDEEVGSLTSEEVMFLQSKNANILTGNGGHDEPFEDFLEKGFSEAFGIE